MKSHSSVFLFATALLLAPVSAWALSDAGSVAGRELVKRYADSVVGIEMVVTVKVTMGERAMPPRENKVEINGTVLNAAGLTVTSLAAIDPRVQFEAMRASMGANGQRMEVSETDYKEVKLRLADGTEVPARVVLKDSDLDLAFIAPEADSPTPAAGKAFSPIKLEDAATGTVLDSYFSIYRAPKALQRTPLVRMTSMLGIVEKPRRMFLLSDQQLGCPQFDAQGRVLGISVQNLNGSRSAGLVMLPAADVAEISKQAAAEAAKPAAAPKPAEESAAPIPPAPAPLK